jgi:hypothetical protein
MTWRTPRRSSLLRRENLTGCVREFHVLRHSRNCTEGRSPIGPPASSIDDNLWSISELCPVRAPRNGTPHMRFAGRTFENMQVIGGASGYASSDTYGPSSTHLDLTLCLGYAHLWTTRVSPHFQHLQRYVPDKCRVVAKITPPQASRILQQSV